MHAAITFSPKKASRASLVARVAILLSVCKFGYLARILALSLNFSLLIEDDGRVLAFFFGLIGMHLGG